MSDLSLHIWCNEGAMCLILQHKIICFQTHRMSATHTKHTLLRSYGQIIFQSCLTVRVMCAFAVESRHLLKGFSISVSMAKPLLLKLTTVWIGWIGFNSFQHKQNNHLSRVNREISFVYTMRLQIARVHTNFTIHIYIYCNLLRRNDDLQQKIKTTKNAMKWTNV